MVRKQKSDWYLLDEPEHKDMQDYVKKLLHLYKEYPALYTETKGYGAFEWINAMMQTGVFLVS